MNDSITVKNKLYQLCMEQVDQRISTLQKAMEEAQQASNQETKSSAGDKYETTRAMMQLEKDKSAYQLAAAMQDKQTLDQIDASKEYQVVKQGSLVITNQGNFFIGISSGKLSYEEKRYFGISIASPIGSKLRGLTKGDSFVFNNRPFKIANVI